LKNGLSQIKMLIEKLPAWHQKESKGDRASYRTLRIVGSSTSYIKCYNKKSKG
jgi:hypothetical protein